MKPTIITPFLLIAVIIVTAKAQIAEDNGGQEQEDRSSEGAVEDERRFWQKCSLNNYGGGCLKRAARQDEMGPFWANRGKKLAAPKYDDSRLYAQIPRWLLMRPNLVQEDYDRLMEPFFVTRGKKDDRVRFGGGARESASGGGGVWDKREAEDSEFFAARGKKSG